MSLDEIAVVVGLIWVVICWAGYRYYSENVYIKGKYDRGRYLKYKEQKVGVRTKWWRK